jgi:hypothetical protein
VVVDIWGWEHSADVVHRQTYAAISCCQCDTKHRKRHHYRVSFSNHKRLKLHMCMYGSVSLKGGGGQGGRNRQIGRQTEGRGGRKRKIYFDVCFPVGL